ncbi:MAG: ATP-binding protein, partial [Planctomycetota bacterium]
MTKGSLFDRKPYLEILEKRVNGLLEGYRQNLAIIGDELVGKTSIIYKFLDKFYDNRIIMLYLEIRPESLLSFVRRFIGVLLFNFLSNSGMPLKEDLEYLIKKSESYIPQATEKIKLILAAADKRKTTNIYTELLSLCETIHEESGKFVVVIFDEFHNLENIGIKNLYRDWSRLLITQKSTMYIIISSMKFKAKSILAKNLSLLFGNFEVINVEPFDIKTSGEYLTDKLCGLNINAGIKDFLVHFTGGYPFYLEVIAEAMLNARQSELADLLESLFFDASGILNQRFSNYIKRFLDSGHGNDYLSILYLIASGSNKIKDIAHILKKQKKEFDIRMNRLLELDTVTRSGDFLKINDRIFGFWLRFVYQEKLHALTFDAQRQKAKFRDNISELIQDFLANA